MAKAQPKNAQAPSNTGASPRPNDAERLAALRWLVMRIEQLSIELFVTDRETFAEVEASLRAQVKTLQRMAPPPTVASVECPDGHVLCRDGLCAPMCDDSNTLAASSRQLPQRSFLVRDGLAGAPVGHRERSVRTGTELDPVRGVIGQVRDAIVGKVLGILDLRSMELPGLGTR
jgi:hypothetical protein